ncbi:MAG: YHS domain-containing protein [Muricauda sp.]|nr:YHS domain-containing protein [Allomuricauda sp.]
MRKILLVLFLAVGAITYAQSIDYNTKKGYAANGYDVVSYFDGKALEGQKEYTTEYDGVKYKFANEANLNKFKAKPTSFLPEYGGYCAYAVAVNGKKVSINPQTYEIRDGKLYLFYNSGNTNTLNLWLDESPDNLKQKADKNWEKIKN